jgi:hypothetical protein
VRQEQDGDEGSTNLQAGRDIVYNGLSVEQMGELKEQVGEQVVGEVERFASRQMETIRSDFVKFTGEANAQALATAQQMLTMFIEQLATKAPDNVGSIRTPSMQQAILTASTSAAVADDEKMTATLVDILVDKCGTEPQSFKGVVLSEALLVAPKLTPDQFNLLTALVMVVGTFNRAWLDDEQVLAGLAAQCQPLYGQLPKSYQALQYMSYTGVGSIERTSAMFSGKVAIGDTIVRSYDAIFTNGFTLEELPVEVREKHMEVIRPLPLRFEQQNRYRLFSGRAATVDEVVVETHPLFPHKDAVLGLIKDRQIDVAKFMKIAQSLQPEFAAFLRELDDISASMFDLSTVGMALGQANWRRLQPETAPDFGIFL